MNLTLSLGQIDVLSAARLTKGTGIDVTVIVTDAVFVLGLAQPKLLVSSTVITSPFTRLELEYEEVVESVPVCLSEVHLYVGVVPSLLTVVVNDTCLPSQIDVLGLGVIVIVGTAVPLTVTVYVNAAPAQVPAVDVGIIVYTTLTVDALFKVSVIGFTDEAAPGAGVTPPTAARVQL